MVIGWWKVIFVGRSNSVTAPFAHAERSGLAIGRAHGHWIRGDLAGARERRGLRTHALAFRQGHHQRKRRARRRPRLDDLQVDHRSATPPAAPATLRRSVASRVRPRDREPRDGDRQRARTLRVPVDLPPCGERTSSCPAGVVHQDRDLYPIGCVELGEQGQCLANPGRTRCRIRWTRHSRRRAARRDVRTTHRPGHDYP